MSRIILKFLNGIYGWIIGVVILIAAIYAGYSIWDNAQIYQAAESVQEQIRKMKPDANTAHGPGFDELHALNGDVVAWLTVDGTNIDSPVLQGDTNLIYMDRDVYGNFSLAGSLFLDTRNQVDFSESYALIYGHNMDEHLMFGDLAMFKDKDFFAKNTTATLMIPGESRKLKIAAVLQTSAGTEEIFNPDLWKNNLNGLGAFLENNSIWYHADLVQMLVTHPENMEVVSLVTCSEGSTNDRTALILVREKPGTSENISGENKNSGKTNGNSAIGGNGPKKTGDSQNPKLWMTLIVGILLFIFAFEGIDRYRSRHKNS